MRTSNEIIIKGDYDEIFSLAATTEDWGRILPHYRYVRLLKQRGNHKLVKMSAWRDFIPVTWTAIETVEPGTAAEPGRIFFHHVRGLVRGMDVEWSFQGRRDGSYLVRITHELSSPPFPTRILPPALIEKVVGEGFIGYIANKTLARIKQLVEG